MDEALIEILVRHYVEVTMKEFTSHAKQEIAGCFENEVVPPVQQVLVEMEMLAERMESLEAKVSSAAMQKKIDAADSKVGREVEAAMCEFSAIVKQDVAACVENDVLDNIARMQEDILMLSNKVFQMQVGSTGEAAPDFPATQQDVFDQDSLETSGAAKFDESGQQQGELDELREALKVRQKTLEDIRNSMAFLDEKKDILTDRVEEASRDGTALQTSRTSPPMTSRVEGFRLPPSPLRAPVQNPVWGGKVQLGVPTIRSRPSSPQVSRPGSWVDLSKPSCVLTSGTVEYWPSAPVAGTIGTSRLTPLSSRNGSLTLPGPGSSIGSMNVPSLAYRSQPAWLL